MKRLVLLLYIFLCSCGEPDTTTAPRQDSILHTLPSDPAVQGDTDDHNRPSPEANPLDAPPAATPRDTVPVPPGYGQ